MYMNIECVKYTCIYVNSSRYKPNKDFRTATTLTSTKTPPINKVHACTTTHISYKIVRTSQFPVYHTVVDRKGISAGAILSAAHALD